jgi:hypothetical protein
MRASPTWDIHVPTQGAFRDRGRDNVSLAQIAIIRLSFHPTVP